MDSGAWRVKPKQSDTSNKTCGALQRHKLKLTTNAHILSAAYAVFPYMVGSEYKRLLFKLDHQNEVHELFALKFAGLSTVKRKTHCSQAF